MLVKENKPICETKDILSHMETKLDSKQKLMTNEPGATIQRFKKLQDLHE